MTITNASPFVKAILNVCAKYSLLLFLLWGSFPLAGQNASLWQDIAQSAMRTADEERKIVPTEYRTLELNVSDMQRVLRTAPRESTTPPSRSNTALPIPLPEGTFETYQLVEYALLHPELSARYPDIKTFRGVSTTNPANTIRVTWSALGFEALITRENGTVAVSPIYRGNQRYYQAYHKQNLPRDTDFACHVQENTTRARENELKSAKPLGSCGNLRVFETAMAASGEYSALVSPNNTKAEVLSEIANLMNALNAVYEKDLAVRLMLIANNDQIIYLDENTDPFTSTDLLTLINQNQANTDAVIGEENYDLGHLLWHTGGGLAGPTPCDSGSEARGISGTANPTGPTFYIDLVAHEIGHQFGANHTFNGTAGACNGNRNLSTAYEPGSGTTIMAYAGICAGQNIQPNSDPYFHNISLIEMQNLITNFATCATLDNTGNANPTVDAGLDYAIPVATPFTLTATGSGVNTYAWEQFDNESSPQPPESTSTAGPNFRSLPPTLSSSRTFPSLANQLTGNTDWEVLPTVGRTMDFKVTARDNNTAGGCTADDLMTITFDDNTGPFTVTAPNTTVSWSVNTTQTVTWDVANTTNAPVSCGSVDILLSIDGGLTYPITLAANVTNDGTHDITVPDVSTSAARVQVKCSTSIFFDISDTNFSIGQTCIFYDSGDTPQTIDPNTAPVTVTSVISIPDANSIADVNVTLQGTHTWVSDLTFTLQSPQGTTITLLSGRCSNQDDFNITLDDQAPDAITCPISAGNTEQPENPLSAFNGENATGDWVLTVTDNFQQDGGELTSWTLNICTDESSENCTNPPPSSGTIAGGTYQTDNSISTAGQILAPSTVVFKAENSITLTPGFVAQQGSSFTATIESCSAIKPARTIVLRPEKEEVDPEKTTLTVFPNPFRNQASIRYHLPKAATVSIAVFDVNGQRVAQPVQQSQQARGDYQFTFNAIDYPQGMYVIFLRTKETVVAKRLILLE